MHSNGVLTQDRMVSREVRPGLTASYCDYVCRDSQDIKVEVDSSLYFGVIVQGVDSPLKVKGLSEFNIRRKCPVMLALGERVSCLGEQVGGVRNVNLSVCMSLEYVRSLARTFNSEIFEEFLSKMEGDVNMCQLPHSTQFLSVVNSVLNCPYAGGLADMHLESCTLSLVAEVAHMLTNGVKEFEDSELTQREYDRVQQVRVLLEENLANPLSLAELSREIGINPTTMSAHFRKVFGDTIFSFLRKCRLELAQSMLKEQDVLISQVGYNVGFSNPAAFTTAYRRHFGYSPSEEHRLAV